MTGNGQLSYYSRPNKRAVLVDLTPSQKAEALVKHSVLLNSFREELGVFFTAFVMRNNVYPVKSDEDKTPCKEPTQEEKSRILRANQMSQGINKANVFGQIGHAK